MFWIWYKHFDCNAACVGSGRLTRYYSSIGWAKLAARKYVGNCPLDADVIIAKDNPWTHPESIVEIVRVHKGFPDRIPEKFNSYSDWSLWFDEHDDEFETECDCVNAEGYGFCVHYHRPSGRYFYESLDENDAEMVEVKKTNHLIYTADMLNNVDAHLEVLFPCTVCGETVHDDCIEFAWYDSIGEVLGK